MDRIESSARVALDSVDTIDVCFFLHAQSCVLTQTSETRYAGTYVILIPFILHETRSTIVITKIAQRLRKKTGDKRYRARVEDEGINLKKLIWISCTRPVCEWMSANSGKYESN